MAKGDKGQETRRGKVESGDSRLTTGDKSKDRNGLRGEPQENVAALHNLHFDSIGTFVGFLEARVRRHFFVIYLVSVQALFGCVVVVAALVFGSRKSQ